MNNLSRHFSMQTGVVRNNVRGTIVGFGKGVDSPETKGIHWLHVSWSDGTKSDIPNPRTRYGVKW